MKQIAKQFEASIKEIADRKRQETLRRVAAATPVKTGRARDSWRVEGTSVVSDVDYMDDLNRGTSQQAGPRFIERAILSDSSLTPNGTIVLNR